MYHVARLADYTHTHHLPSIKMWGDISVQVFRKVVYQKMVFISSLSTV